MVTNSIRFRALPSHITETAQALQEHFLRCRLQLLAFTTTAEQRGAAQQPPRIHGQHFVPQQPSRIVI